MVNNSSLYACPLTTYDYFAPQVYGTPTTVLGLQWDNNTLVSGQQPGLTGTKLPNGINAVSNGSYYAWSTANGGRNDAFTGNYARKVLVMMIDGVNELFPTVGTPVNIYTWDTDVVTAASTLKLGLDGTAGTEDDVEIYVVGFFCSPYSTSTTATPDKWCKSDLADSASPHPCPNNVWPASGFSATDTLLKNVSSSSAGTCDHYYPILKTESLPQLFRVLAGSVARGRLSE